MSLTKARADRKRLAEKRSRVSRDVMRKTAERRELQEQRRKLIHARKQKKRRDPESEAREAILQKKIAALHDEIMKLGDELDSADQRIAELSKIKTEITKRIEAIRRRIKKLLRSSGPDAAVRAAENDNGKHEEPAGSNWGPYVSKVIKWLGYSGPVYWCGCAAGWWTLKKGGGSATSKIRRGYAGYIAADARAGVNGLKQTSSPVKGGYATLWNYEHIVMTTGRTANGMFETWEGNTSAADGSQSNGGEVATKWRAFSDADIFCAQSY